MEAACLAYQGEVGAFWEGSSSSTTRMRDKVGSPFTESPSSRLTRVLSRDPFQFQQQISSSESTYSPGYKGYNQGELDSAPWCAVPHSSQANIPKNQYDTARFRHKVWEKSVQLSRCMHKLLARSPRVLVVCTTKSISE